MTAEFITEIEADAKALWLKISGNTAVKAVEADVEAIGTATVSYIKTNGLQDLYQLALGLLPTLVGAPWGATLAALEAKALEMGKVLLTGASAIVASQAQADLIAAGKLIAPVATAA